MRILVIGCNGQLGNELRRILSGGEAEIGAISDAYHDAFVDYVDIDKLDISDAESVQDFFAARRYDLVINGAAYTNVDGCEKNEGLAYEANAMGPKNIATACAKYGMKFVHVSTDYVFPGNVAGDRIESDTTAPISAYGCTKLSGEQFALAANPKTYVVRTAWLYGYVGRNFVKTMKGLGEKLDEVTVVDDQLGNPTSANDLAFEILEIATTDYYGIYHCTNEGTCSWADFAEAIMNGFKLDCKVNRCTSAEYKAAHPESADRPAFSSLKNEHLEKTIGNRMRPWQDALATYIEKYPCQAM